MKSINCNGQLIDLSQPRVMGIINVTPDSFYTGSRAVTETKILKQAETMLSEGATFLDIGGYSSRPGADDVSITDETQRVIPAIEAILKSFPDALISIDTFRSEVARAAIDSGAALINDISGGQLDENMLHTVAELRVPYILMHMRGTPQTMTQHTTYDNLIEDILYYFSERIAQARNLGITDVIADPGFGFSKTIAQNFELLNSLSHFRNLDVPLLVGVSRKSMIYKTLGTTAEEALNGTTALNALALNQGAAILRVHDVAPAMECVKLIEKLNVSMN